MLGERERVENRNCWVEESGSLLRTVQSMTKSWVGAGTQHCAGREDGREFVGRTEGRLVSLTHRHVRGRTLTSADGCLTGAVRVQGAVSSGACQEEPAPCRG